MRTRLTWILLTLLLAGTGCRKQLSWISFYQYNDQKEVVIPRLWLSAHQIEYLADILDDRRFVLEGCIKTVCQQTGCSIVLTGDNGHDILVLLTESDTCGDGFFVPRNAAGHKVFAFGYVKSVEVSEADARRDAKDAGKSEAEIATIIGPQRVNMFIADMVSIAQREKLDPPVSLPRDHKQSAMSYPKPTDSIPRFIASRASIPAS